MDIRKVMRIATIAAMILGWLAILGTWLFLILNSHLTDTSMFFEDPYIQTMTVIVSAMFAAGIAYLFKTSQHRNQGVMNEVKI